jgi:hypothetical protein
MSGQAHGGNDVFTDTGLTAQDTFYGDAGKDIGGDAIGGNDTFVGGLRSSVTFYGDAGGDLGGQATGGNDTFTGGALGTSLAYGDALTMSGNAQGGNDKLVGSNAAPAPAGTYASTLVGDAQIMSGDARGGNDTLISGTGNDDMWGDARVLLGNAKGGNDTFVFNFNNGHDKIEDFGQAGDPGLPASSLGTDHIDVTALGITGLGQLNISTFDLATHESTITFSPGNDVVVHSEIALTARDFLFA